MLLQSYVRSVSIDFEGVDAVLCQAFCLQERTVVTHLHALACEIVSLEQLHPVVFSMLGEDNDVSHTQHYNTIIDLHLPLQGSQVSPIMWWRPFLHMSTLTKTHL